MVGNVYKICPDFRNVNYLSSASTIFPHLYFILPIHYCTFFPVLSIIIYTEV